MRSSSSPPPRRDAVAVAEDDDVWRGGDPPCTTTSSCTAPSACMTSSLAPARRVAELLEYDVDDVDVKGDDELWPMAVVPTAGLRSSPDCA